MPLQWQLQVRATESWKMRTSNVNSNGNWSNELFQDHCKGIRYLASLDTCWNIIYLLTSPVSCYRKLKSLDAGAAKFQMQSPGMNDANGNAESPSILCQVRLMTASTGYVALDTITSANSPVAKMSQY